jgi:hypothetical protein
VRTTLDLDDNLLQIARQIGHQRRMTIGQVISELALASLTSARSPDLRNGVPIFETGSQKPNLELVNRLRDES